MAHASHRLEGRENTMSRDEITHALAQVIQDLNGDEKPAKLHRRIIARQIIEGGDVEEELANAMSHTTLNNAMRGIKLPDLYTLKQIAGAFGMEAWELVKRAERGPFLEQGGKSSTRRANSKGIIGRYHHSRLGEAA